MAPTTKTAFNLSFIDGLDNGIYDLKKRTSLAPTDKRTICHYELSDGRS